MKSLFFIILFLIPIFTEAKVVLPDVLSDNMVLQQNSYIKLWGTAKPRKYVKVKTSWSTKEYKYFSRKNGSWFVSIKTPKGSFTPQTITITDGSITTIQNILIGEVWFCSGQSNMEMPFKGFNNQPIEGAQEVIDQADPNNGIRMVSVKRNPQDCPVSIAEGKWMLSTKDNVPKFSATAYFFALKLRKELNLPIGIINSSWGGSSVEGWMNKDLADNYDDLDLNLKIPDNENWKKPCIMYNGMLKPFKDYVVKGFVWYQGESNIGRNATYASKLNDMATLWRYEWQNETLPFYIVEIAPYLYEHPIDAAKLREAQFKASNIITYSGIVSTNDLVRPDEANIVHPSMKKPIGERLANLALANNYGFDTICAVSPSYERMEIKENQVIIYLKNVHDQVIQQPNFEGFEIAGEDQVFHSAHAILNPDKKSFVVQAIDVQNPVAVRYCFKNHQLGNVKNDCGLPLIPFRTDNW